MSNWLSIALSFYLKWMLSTQILKKRKLKSRLNVYYHVKSFTKLEKKA